MPRVFSLFVVLMIACASMLGGCTSVSTGPKLDSKLVSTIQKDVSTMSEVHAKLGAPTSVNMLADGGRQWVYASTNFSNDPGAGGMAAMLIPGASLVAGSTSSTTMHTVQIRFDAQGIVRDIDDSSNTQKMENHGVLGGTTTTNSGSVGTTTVANNTNP